jgi:Mn2+/Fe2+ NRAMP family transporter
MHEDVNTGMILSNLVAFFIILTTAATLAAHGITKIETAQDAANALRPLAGNFAYVLFSAGMVGTGLLAIPALSGSSAFVVAEIMRFREGFDQAPQHAPQFYAVIVGSLLVGVAMNLLHVNAIQALFWSAVINGIAAVPLIAVVIALANRKKLMGRWRPSRLANAWACLTLGVMAFAAIAMFVF